MNNSYNWIGKTALIVDPNFISRLYFKSLFEIYGANAYGVKSIEEAELVIGASLPDIVLMEITFDNYKLCDSLFNELLSDVASIAYTSDIRLKRNLEESNFSDFLIKPIRIADLKIKIDRCLNEKEAFDKAI